MTKDPTGDSGALDRRDFLKRGGTAATGFLAGRGRPQPAGAALPFPQNPVTAGAMPTRDLESVPDTI